MDFRIIDAHTHTYPEKIADKAAKNLAEFYNFDIEEDGTFLSLIECEKKAGIGGFITLPVATGASHVDKINEMNSDNMLAGRQLGMEAYSFGCMHQDYGDFEKGVKYIKSLGLYGIKIHPDLQRVEIDDKRLLELYSVMESEGISLYLHVGDKRPQYYYSSPDRVAKIASMFPKMKICAAHFGGYSVWEEAEKCLMGRFDNVWYDCSASLDAITPNKAKEYLSACGYDKMMFGSDFPSVSPSRIMREFARLNLDEKTSRDIMCYNARRFLGVCDG